MSINKKELIPQEDIIKKKVNEINPDKIIQETINSCLEKDNINKLNDDKEELLKMISEQSVHNYLEYVKGRTSKEGKEFLQKELEAHNNKLKAILIKSDAEKNEYKNKYLNILVENQELKDKIIHIENLNKNLSQKLKQLEINSQNFEIQMININKKKLFLNELFERYPGKSEEEILKYLDELKSGSIQMLNDYQNIVEKIKELNNEQKEKEKEFKISMNKLYLNNETLMKDKNNLINQYSNKIDNIENIKKANEQQKNRTIYLSNTLFHLYNLLFKEFGLNRNLKIDKKYLDVKEFDFNPNFFYDEEIKNYIEIMIKSMHHNTYDKLFRETIGYLNLILRIYLPNKMDLRYQPAKAFKEIKDFIDSKVTIIEDNQNLIKSYETAIEKKDIEITKLRREQKELNKEYNLYKTLVEKEFVKTNKIIYQLKNSNSKKDINYNKEINYNKTYNKTFNNIRTQSSTMNFDNIERIIPYKLKLKRKGIILKEEEIKVYNNDYNKPKPNEKNDKDNLSKSNKIRTLNSEPKKIKRGKNKDKIIRENGNQQRFNDFNKVKLLIDETNRLFLYKSRMNSTIARHEVDEDTNNKNQIKNKIIVYGDNCESENKIKNKIFSQINHLLKNKDKYN